MKINLFYYLCRALMCCLLLFDIFKGEFDVLQDYTRTYFFNSEIHKGI